MLSMPSGMATTLAVAFVILSAHSAAAVRSLAQAPGPAPGPPAPAFAPPVPSVGAETSFSDPPYAIGHRGLCGVFPEHTLASYQGAIDHGADFVECDVVFTKDCQFVCRHEPELSQTTDVMSKFPELNTTYLIDGANQTGVFTFNLTLAQIKTLWATQRVPIRDQSMNQNFRVPTLDEYLAVVGNASRIVGIYPETKHPSFLDSLNLTCFNGKSFTQALVEKLNASGYNASYQSPAWRRKPIFLQSFERQNLITANTPVPKVFLLDDTSVNIPYENVTYGDFLQSKSQLQQLYNSGVQFLGPWKNIFVPYYSNGTTANLTAIPSGQVLLNQLHSMGYGVHIYTLRTESIRPDGSGFLPFTFWADPYYEYDLYFKTLGIDGAFDDQSNTLARYIAQNNLKGTGQYV